ncbi:hypothetical protein CAOG_004797 [Capsaspora owczarzaki ATCC 30864]|uniref:Uncharacterized protein n=1 Tax=Capsaspora owczarzaki (strain ATCC 30864) TaxID=595528 RepID=A0A0D2VSN3_CAPO3|nr:hypothetical protein CAOG_004797 [Capsaspora owczarzaki ATCC 30864]
MYAFHRFATAGAVSAAQGVPELVASMTSTAAAAKPQPKSAVAIKAAAKEFCHIYRNSALPDLLVCAVTAPVSPSEAFEFAATLLTHVHADRVLAFDAALKSSINGLYDDPENDDSDYDYDSGHRGALVCALATAAWRRDGRLPARALPTANMVTGAPAALLSHCEVIGTPAALLLALQESVEISPELLLAMDAVITSDNSQLGTVAPALAPLQADALRAAFKSAGPASDSALASVPGAIHLVLSASTTTAATFVRPTPDSLYL